MHLSVLFCTTVLIFGSALTAGDDARTPKEQNPDAQLQSLMAEYEKAVDDLSRQQPRGSLDTLSENLRYFNRLSQLQRQFTGQFLELSREHSKAKKAYEALRIVAVHGEAAQSNEATDLMLRYHADKLPDFCDDMDSRGWPPQEGMMRKLLEHSINDKMEKAVSLGLGRLLKSKSEGLEARPVERAKWSKEAEGLYEKIATKPGLDADTAQALQSIVWELRNLGIGKKAPEITGKDADGKEFKLTDYQGKVVVLDFWGGW